MPILRLEMCFLLGLILSTDGRPTSAIKTLQHLDQESDSGDTLDISTIEVTEFQRTLATAEHRSKHIKSCLTETSDSSLKSFSSKLKCLLKKIGSCSKDREATKSLSINGIKPLASSEQINTLKHNNKTNCEVVLDFIQLIKKSIFHSREGVVETINTVEHLERQAILELDVEDAIINNTTRGCVHNHVTIDNKENVQSSNIISRSRRNIFNRNEHSFLLKNTSKTTHGNVKDENQTEIRGIARGVINGLSNSKVERSRLMLTDHQDAADVIRIGTNDVTQYGARLSGSVVQRRKGKQDIITLKDRVTKLGEFSKQFTYNNNSDSISDSREFNDSSELTQTTPKYITFPERVVYYVVINIDEVYSILRENYRIYRRKYFGSDRLGIKLKDRGTFIQWHQRGPQRWWFKPSIKRLCDHMDYLKAYEVLINGILGFEKRQSDNENVLSGLNVLKIFCARLRLSIYYLIRKYTESAGESDESIRQKLTSLENRSFQLHSILVLRELRAYLHRLILEIEQLIE